MIRELHVGRHKTGISIQADPDWPGMWRVRWRGRVSDMVNLTRAKDAAMSWYSQDQGRGMRRGDVVVWRDGGAERPVAPPVSYSEGGARVVATQGKGQ